MSRLLITALALMTFLSFSFTALAQDLKDAEARQKIAAQKLTADVKEEIARSYKQDPLDAKFALRRMLERVNDSQDLLVSEKSDLRRSLQTRLNVVEDAVRSKNVTQSQTPLKDPPKYKAPTPNPTGGVGSVAKGFQDGAKGAQKANGELIREREKSIVAINLAIEKSPSLTADPIAFPSYWKELTERRKKLVGPQLTEKEVALLKTLNSTLTADAYDGQKFKAVINHLQEKTGLNIIIDEGSLRDVNLDYEADTVTFPKIGKVTVRTILKKVLGDKGLTYIIKEGNLQVMTPKKASEHTVVRTYQIDDLVSASPQTLKMFGPFMAEQQVLQNARQLANLIAMTIEPSYWQPNGPGTIQFFQPTRSLIIRASAEMHYQLGSPGLFGGR